MHAYMDIMRHIICASLKFVFCFKVLKSVVIFVYRLWASCNGKAEVPTHKREKH